MTLNELKDNQTVTYRLGFHGPTQVSWQDWQNGPIYVVRRQFDYKGKGKGELLTLTPRNQGWAAYSQRDYHGDGFFDCEEFCMQIKDLV